MSQKIDIGIGGIRVGCITFDESPVQLFAHRTATGFNLSIPATVELDDTDSSKPCPMVSNLKDSYDSTFYDLAVRSIVGSIETIKTKFNRRPKSSTIPAGSVYCRICL